MLPWDKGNEGWEYFADFQSWFTQQFLDCGQYESNEDWIDNCPTFLMSVFESFAESIEKQIKSQEAK